MTAARETDTAPGASAAVALADVQRLLSLFTQGLSGRYLHLKPTDALTGDFRPDGGTTDGTSIYLPAAVDSFDTARHNLGVYRVSVLHQLGFYEGGTFEFSLAPDASAAPLAPGNVRATKRVTPLPTDRPTDLEQFFSQWPAPRAMRRLFMTLEDLRIDAAMRVRYPGVRDDLARVLAHALAQRLAGDAAATAEAPGSAAAPLFEALVRYSLGADRTALLSGDRTGLLALMLDAAHTLEQPGASVYDTVQAATVCYRAMARALGAAGHPDEATPEQSAPPAPAGGPTQPGGEGGDEAGMDDPLLHDDDLAGAPVDFRGEVRPELVQRQLRAGNTGTLLDAGAADESEALTPAERKRLEHERYTDQSALRRAFGSVGTGTRSYLYDEWDYHRQAYLKGWCRLFEHPLKGDDTDFIRGVRERHAVLAHQVKRQFKFIKPESYQRVRRVSDGEELELDGVIEAVIDRRAGHATDEHVYRRRDRALREVSAVFLLDMSASTDFAVPDRDAPPPPPAEPPPPRPGSEFVYAFWHDYPESAPAPAKRRVIDVAKESLALMAQALETLGDAYAIYGFSGYGRDDVEFHVAKEFDDRLNARTWSAMAAMQPRRSTRMGPAIRHALAKLAPQAARMKVMIIVSDGYPQDCDYGPDRNDDEYGIQDTAAALREAQQKGVQTFCMTIDPAGHDYLRRMCPDDRYLVLDEVADLPRELSKVYRALTA